MKIEQPHDAHGPAARCAPGNRSRRRSRGLTLIELLVALTIASVLMGVGIPAFQNFVEQRTMTTRINDFVLAVNYARSEAARLGGTVSIQAVDGGDGDNEWGAGYCVVVGTPGDCDGTVLRMFAGINGAVIDATGGLDNAEVLSFNSRGLLLGGVDGELNLCSNDENKDPGRAIAVSVVGRISTSQLTCHPE